MMAFQRAPGKGVSRTPVPKDRIREAKTKLVQLMSKNVRWLKSNDRIEESTLVN